MKIPTPRWRNPHQLRLVLAWLKEKNVRIIYKPERKYG